MVEADEGPRAGQRSQSGKRCRVCGKEAEKLFQNDSCRDCLVHSFGKYIKMIDHFRDLRR